MKKCYELLNETSRSFAAVILALDDELRYTSVHFCVECYSYIYVAGVCYVQRIMF